jgi:DNA invertase Pin-like site-specific DNA recombinase
MSTVESAMCPAQGFGKIQSRHLDRLAMVYVRQSTYQQVLEHRESAAIQYGLRCRATEWGWPLDRVVIIDQDQGHSACSADGRAGFQQLLAEVGLDHVGIILGMEMSRLARSCKDWHQLLELCAIFGVLLADQEGMYDPQQYNDRLLLGLKGTISEAELHLIRQRSWNGLMNKARRGQLHNHPPVGYVCRPDGELDLDPDEQVQAVVRLIFAKFDQIGSVYGVLRYLVINGIQIPMRSQSRANKGALELHRPNQTTLSNILQHPLYAGAYSWGRRPIDRRHKVAGRPGGCRRTLKPEDCLAFIKDRCPAFITWDQHQRNLRRLQQNRSRMESPGVSRGGQALLSGLVICGKCGCRLRVAYHDSDYRRYTCMTPRAVYGLPICQGFTGRPLEQLVERQVLRVLEPAAVELALAAADDVEREHRTLNEQWRLRLERARYATDRAARQYHAVEPENRLVARELERRWEECMQAQRGAEEEYERFCKQQPAALTEVQLERVRALAKDVPALWRSQECSAKDRQDIVRCLVDQVVVNTSASSPTLEVAIHFAGGFVSHHELRRPVGRWDQLPEYPQLISRVKELTGEHRTAGQIAQKLNQEGWHPPKQRATFNAPMVQMLLARVGSPGKRPARMVADLLKTNEWWLSDLARELDVAQPTLHNWLRRGWVHARQLRGPQSCWILWADSDELNRLRSLRGCERTWYNQPMGANLTTPKPRSQET